MIRPTWVEIDLKNIEDNVKNIGGLLKKETKLMAVVKANGYGHGSVETALSAIKAGADRLGIALVEEAIPLRQSGIDLPIHLMTGPVPGSAKAIADYDLIPSVFLESHLEELKGSKCKVHLKVDTGMNRLGLKTNEIKPFLKKIKSIPNISAEGMFTHFATADNPNSELFKRQKNIFNQAVQEFRDEFSVIHAANSAAALVDSETHYDMVRIGIAMYGLKPSMAIKPPLDLKPALSWLAKVTNIKKISKGDCVSYGASFTAGADSFIATVPVGYADGYFRNLSNKTQILLSGKKMPQVGTICMDQFMFLADHNVKVGDTVVLIGNQNSSSLTADDLAEIIGTINYEIVCAISDRVPREYLS